MAPRSIAASTPPRGRAPARPPGDRLRPLPAAPEGSRGHPGQARRGTRGHPEGGSAASVTVNQAFRFFYQKVRNRGDGSRTHKATNWASRV